jgi:hypothetical protein
LQSAEHHGAPSRFRNKAERAEVECAQDVIAVIAGRKDDNRNCWVALMQIGEHVEAVAIRQIQVKQNKLELCVLLDELHCLTAIRGFQDVGITPPFLRTPCSASRIST